MLPKSEIALSSWRIAYEKQNVALGLALGLGGRGQIGKGMWDRPDNMSELLASKIAHPLSGASCAWVPSPTAAVLHATHYHLVDVRKTQDKPPVYNRDDMLRPPLLTRRLDIREVEKEVEANIRGMAGYVRRWLHEGVGCSKISNGAGVNLMEDRATLRIASQHLGNWIKWGLVDRSRVESRIRALCGKDGATCRCVSDLVGLAPTSPDGLTEGPLFKYRRFLIGR